MAIKYRVTVIESERGWGQSREYTDFDTIEKAIEYRDQINDFQVEDKVPEWYMYALKEIHVIET
jgi:hypothetical protein